MWHYKGLNQYLGSENSVLASKQIHRKLQHRGKVFGEFQILPCFPRKMYLSTMFGIIKPSIKLPLLRRFDLVVKETSKQIY